MNDIVLMNSNKSKQLLKHLRAFSNGKRVILGQEVFTPNNRTSRSDIAEEKSL